MSKSVSTSTDKIIVDRSKKHRNKAVFDAVKTTRERLQQGAGASDAYERQMLTMHIAETLQGAMIMPLFIVLASIIGVYITRDISLIIWSLAALSFHAI
ncbi:MAG: sensor histidine kinase, partial [Rhizobium oryzihabitans]